ncbi:NAD(P)/FAD-dependent oxidoreductase [Halobellus sp. EA9]|uniref:NAD(P)/FAD-dependent oxidoreductase n=1 Tax=Halobellus sp. EA9 TaxID=3421647 RepID=UPI003EC0A203
MDERSIAVVGGAVAGLAAADRLAADATVTLFERQSYDEKRVNCGEAINDAPLIPLEKTPENGFLNDVDGFELRIFRGRDHGPSDEPLGDARIRCAPGYITDRNVVERRWAERLAERGVDVRENAAVGPNEFRELCRTHDYVIDATGQPALSMRAFGDLDAYTGEIVAVNADVTGDFAAIEAYPQIFFEGYVGYAWLFPKSDSRANLGIGWAGDERPDDYYEALTGACRRNDLPVPDRSETNIYTIPRGPSLDPAATYRAGENVFLVGDAAGIANRYQGEGICQAIRSSYLAAETIAEGRPETYPERLYDLMRSEYRLAHLMRGVWVEHGDARLLADIAEALDGLTVDDITRSPRRVVARVARHPGIAYRLLTDAGMLQRVVDAYTDTWEYDQPYA